MSGVSEVTERELVATGEPVAEVRWSEDRRPSLTRDLVFFTLAVAALLPSIWSITSISGQDEYWLSFRTVLEMQERGEWLTPYVDGAVRLKKPPLLYWLMRIACEVFGTSPFAARLPVVLFGAGFALGIQHLHRALGGRGYLAGAMALVTAGVAIESRRAMFDLPVASLVTAALCCAVSWWRRGGWGWAAACGSCLAAAAMTKGPVALWFFLAPLLAVMPWRGSVLGASRWRWREAVLLLVVFAALALPWPLAIAARHPQFWGTMDEQLANREFGGLDLARAGKLLGGACGLVVPWVLLLLEAVVAVVRGQEQRLRERKVLLVWVVLGIAPFAFMKTFERYLLALLCPMVCLAAMQLAVMPVRRVRMHLQLAAALLALPTLGFSLFVFVFGLAWLAPFVAVLLVAAGFIAARRWPERPLRAVVMLGATMTMLLGFVYPAIGINALPASLAAELGAEPVATFARSQPGMLSIVLQRSVRQVDLDADGAAAPLRGRRGHVFVLDQDVEVFERALAAAGVRHQRRGSFRSFYSRKTWLSFTRAGVGLEQWREALRSGSVAALQPEFVHYHLPGDD